MARVRDEHASAAGGLVCVGVGTGGWGGWREAARAGCGHPLFRRSHPLFFGGGTAPASWRKWRLGARGPRIADPKARGRGRRRGRGGGGARRRGIGRHGWLRRPGRRSGLRKGAGKTESFSLRVRIGCSGSKRVSICNAPWRAPGRRRGCLWGPTFAVDQRLRKLSRGSPAARADARCSRKGRPDPRVRRGAGCAGRGA